MRSGALAVVACVVGLAVAGCGGDGAPPPTTTGNSGRTVKGFQFTTVVPQGWTDVSSQFTSPGSRYDVAYADVSEKGFKPNLLVLRRSGPDYTRKSLVSVDAMTRRALKAAGGPEPGPSTRLQLGDEPALQRTTKGRQQGLALERREVLTLREGTLYVLGVTTTQGDPRAGHVLDAAVRGWSWTLSAY